MDTSVYGKTLIVVDDIYISMLPKSAVRMRGRSGQRKKRLKQMQRQEEKNKYNLANIQKG